MIVKVYIDGRVDRIPEFDPRSGSHLWIVINSYRVDPAKMATEETHLDQENLLLVTPPGCYYCEEPYEPRLLRRRCPGKPAA